MQRLLTQIAEAPSTGFGLTWILKHVDTSASNERKEPSNQVGDGPNCMMGSWEDGNGGGGLQDL